MKRLLAASLLLTACIQSASADFTIAAPGPMDSAGPVGDSGNGTFSGVFAGPSAIWGTLNFTGNISPVIGGTYLSEARWRITGPSGASVNYQPSGTATFPANTPVAASSSVFMFASAGLYSFEAFESFNDGPGADSTWNSASFNFVDSTNPITMLGTYANNTPFRLDTNGSDYDTELGLYDSVGNLIANDDDGGNGVQSLINPGVLAPGSYYLLVGGYNSSFANSLAAAGGAFGNFSLQLNDGSLASGASAANVFNIFQFDVSSTPAPAAVWMGLAGLGVLGAMRRRFKNA